MSRTQNAHLTFKANVGVGRHGWLRLTPAYSVQLVRQRVSHLPEGSVITDPFSGTGTTPLAAAEQGHTGQSLDVNPFLVWLGSVKTKNYDLDILEKIQAAIPDLLASARAASKREDLWQPNLFKIERWWSPGKLLGLKAIRDAIDLVAPSEDATNLFSVAFCRILIAHSNAAFNHQSMSFKNVDSENTFVSFDDAEAVFAAFSTEAEDLLGSARLDLDGSAKIILADSRGPEVRDLEPCDLLLTSPPYVNRMSYIRELRPYMYWLRYLDEAVEAGKLDWEAIGGTWGMATSRLNGWESRGGTPIDDQLSSLCAKISRAGEGRSGALLSNYVAKYFEDMWEHFQSAQGYVKSGGAVSYIIGNSTFYGQVVPAELWYAEMLRALGFEDVVVSVIRKRNSNKHLFEFDVTGCKP